MANKQVFGSTRGPAADTVNNEGRPAYGFGPKHSLAQFAVTGTFHDSFYVTAEQQIADVLAHCEAAGPEFVAKCAIYGRESGLMKDAPAALVGWLAVHAPEFVDRVFDRVIDNGKMLRNVVQMARSGVFGRKAIPRPLRRRIRRWLETAPDRTVFSATVGNEPSLRDVIRMVHPKGASPERAALLGYIVGRPVYRPKPGEEVVPKVHSVQWDLLPPIVREYEEWKASFGTDREVAPPDVPFQMIDGVIPPKHPGWKTVARNARWQSTRMNLNTFKRHGVFEDEEIVRLVAARLRDKDQIRKARQFPYQILMAYIATEGTDGLPFEIHEALQDALEAACDNVPGGLGRVVVMPDVSGSMSQPVTGDRGSVSSKVRNSDVAALFATALARKNPGALILPFAESVRIDVTLNPRDTVITNARKIGGQPSAGTHLSAPLRWLNERDEKADVLMFVSDNESWMDNAMTPTLMQGGRGDRTAAMEEWQKFQRRCPKATLVCLDVSPNTTTQVKDRPGVLNIGGFSDSVWPVIEKFVKAGPDAKQAFVQMVEAVVL